MPNEKPIPQQIPIEKIHDLPGVTDFKLPEKSYGTLVSSILVNGLREPVILRPMENGEYQLVHGYRRRKAAELAKLKTLDALVYEAQNAGRPGVRNDRERGKGLPRGCSSQSRYTDTR